MTDGKLWPFDERLEDTDMDVETAVAPIAEGDTATPLALPVTLGDRITIHYPEDSEANHRDSPEVWHFGGFRADCVALIRPDDHDRAIENDENGKMPTIYGCVSEGVYRFNERVMKHAERVEIERVEVPEFYHVM